MSEKHVIKFDFDEGERLPEPVLWCGAKSSKGQWYFEDAQHIALSVGGSIAPCKECIKAIISELNKEIGESE